MGPLRSLSCRVFLELFSGSGHMASRMSSLGGAVLMWDISFGPAYDLSKKKVQQLVRGWILAGMVWAVHMGTPCTTYSIARRPAVRSVYLRPCHPLPPGPKEGRRSQHPHPVFGGDPAAVPAHGRPVQS